MGVYVVLYQRNFILENENENEVYWFLYMHYLYFYYFITIVGDNTWKSLSRTRVSYRFHDGSSVDNLNIPRQQTVDDQFQSVVKQMLKVNERVSVFFQNH